MGFAVAGPHCPEPTFCVENFADQHHRASIDNGRRGEFSGVEIDRSLELRDSHHGVAATRDQRAGNFRSMIEVARIDIGRGFSR